MAAAADESQQASQARPAGWSDVIALAAGAAVIVTITGGAPPGARYVLSADDSGLTVMDLETPPMPADAKAGLRGGVPDYRAYLQPSQPDGTWISQDKKVRVGPAGVTVENRTVAEFWQVVRTIKRDDVIEIKTVTIRNAGFAKKYYTRGLPGALLGILAGGLVGAGIDRARDADPSDVSGVFLGIVVGGAAGWVIAMRTGHPTTTDVAVIYQKPRQP